LEKAFDKVPWNDLFNTLEEIGVEYRDKRIIYNLYKDQSAIIKVTDKIETAIIRKDVRQVLPRSAFTRPNIWVRVPTTVSRQ